ncbi:MAG: hypothetical protein K8H90_07510, partial [Thermoanaerobaculia bacterium]|nr:hypothetical protein [Thermoanaerobaculia bacterium]
ERWLAEIGTLRRRTGQSWRRYPLPSEPGVFGSEELVQVLPEGRVVWVGGFGGALKRCDRTRERFTLIGRADRAGREQNGPVFDLLRGRDGALRLATGDGLSRYDEARGRFDHFGPAEGLPGSNVYSLLEDGHGRLWLGTNRGLARFVLRGEEPPAVRVYGPEERVGNVEFNRHARLRIAGDLHDELGSDLSGIALASSRLLSPRTLEPADQRRLSEIEEAPLRVMRGLRDIVWYVDPEHDTLESTAQRMRAVARELMPKVEIRFVEDFADAAAGIEMSARRQVFLVFKELVHNVARHRGCGLRAPLPTMRTSCRTRSRRRRSGVAGRGRESCPSRRR